MYICPNCGKSFSTQLLITKHLHDCWKEQHPYYKSKDAPRSETISVTEIDDGVLEFFAQFNKE